MVGYARACSGPCEDEERPRDGLLDELPFEYTTVAKTFGDERGTAKKK